MWRSIRTLRSIPRLKDIAFILGKHGFHQIASAIQLPVPTRIRRLFRAGAQPIVAQPERLRMVLEDLGPTFIKFGQLLSTRPDLLPQEYIEELAKLQDDVQPAPFDEVRSVIEESFGSGIATLFRSVHTEPLAAASIAQVHRATTHAGEEVVLKVRKRGLGRLIHQDLQVLRLLAELLAGWPGIKLFDPEGIVRLFERSLERELNFDYERYSLMRVRENLGGGDLVIPRVHAELSSERVLTMEFLDGQKLSQVRTSGLDPELGKRAAQAIVSGMLRQIFEHGVYHADPHPGNFILMRDGRVGLIDFGNVGKLTPETVDDLFLLLDALLRRNFRELARWILRKGRPAVEVDANALALELMDTLDPYYGLHLEDIRLGRLFSSLFGMVLRLGISIPAQYVHVGRTFVNLEGVVSLLAPGLEVLPLVQPYAAEILGKRWSLGRLLRDAKADAHDIVAALRTFPGNLAEVLGKAAEGRLTIKAELPAIGGLERKIDQASSRTELALLATGLLISSAILLFKSGETGTLQLAFGGGGFLCGLLVALKLLLRG